ncbi:MAG TPA: 4-alpha-glucanotransferase, partial [Acidimicrobiales bacterium]|nr:4-alpha-glucanotransferase [Acidimicrobiales bacterium]
MNDVTLDGLSVVGRGSGISASGYAGGVTPPEDPCRDAPPRRDRRTWPERAAGYGACIDRTSAGIDPHAWGVEPGYDDVSGTWHDSDPDAVDAVLAAMGAHTPTPPGPQETDVWVVNPGRAVPCEGRWVLHTETGRRMEGDGPLPAGLELGYHDLERRDAPQRVRVIVAPPACYRDTGSRRWGWAAQLYALRSRSSWGIGDLADLAELGRWSRSVGADVVLVNPLHAPLPVLPLENSPYFPSSRSFRNPIYIRVEDVPGSAGLADVSAAAAAGRALNETPLIDRDSVWRLKLSALEAVWAAMTPEQRDGQGDVAAYRARIGETLESYATFCTLTEVHGAGWRSWPAGLERHDTDATREFAAGHADRVAFHVWLQYLLDRQLEHAGASGGVVSDLAIGTDREGADAWRWQDVMANDVCVGAPPDDFNPAGQNWGFAPYDPWKLRAARFEPYIEVV